LRNDPFLEAHRARALLQGVYPFLTQALARFRDYRTFFTAPKSGGFPGFSATRPAQNLACVVHYEDCPVGRAVAFDPAQVLPGYAVGYGIPAFMEAALYKNTLSQRVEQSYKIAVSYSQRRLIGTMKTNLEAAVVSGLLPKDLQHHWNLISSTDEVLEAEEEEFDLVSFG
jgi:hypothetical protein